jgi:hypothetical protein
MNKLKNFLVDPIFNYGVNIIVSDDDLFIRDSCIRILSQSAKKLNIKVNIIEGSDGVETLYLYYICLCRNIKISAIFSDENMNMMRGVNCSELIYKYCNDKGVDLIPYYLVTSEQNIKQNKSCIREILSKPILADDAERILKSII